MSAFFCSDRHIATIVTGYLQLTGQASALAQDLPHYRCELHAHWACCRYDTAAGKLSAAEQAIWDDYAQHFNIKDFEASLGEGR